MGGGVMSEKIKELAKLYAEFEKLKTEAKEKQDRAKEMKDEMINVMDEMGRDEVIISGLDSEAIVLSITYPIREVLNKKALSEALGVPQKELSKPQTWVQLASDGRITSEVIDQFTEEEERMQFSAKVYQEEQDD
jgi:hypothetical protein